MQCDHCKSFKRFTRGVPPHENLQQQGEPRKIKMQGLAHQYDTDYICTACGTKWTYEDDKNDDQTGWVVHS